MFKDHGVYPMLSLTLIKIFLSECVRMNLTLSDTWSHNWASISSHF